MAFTYKSGEKIRAGDLVKYNGSPGRVEFVLVQHTGDPALDWYLEEFPGGGILVTPESFGRLFLSDENIKEDDWLKFVSRAPESG
jgi:hypothetical protein